MYECVYVLEGSARCFRSHSQEMISRICLATSMLEAHPSEMGEYCRHRMKQSKLGYVIKMRSRINFTVDFEIDDLIKNALVRVNSRGLSAVAKDTFQFSFSSRKNSTICVTRS